MLMRTGNIPVMVVLEMRWPQVISAVVATSDFGRGSEFSMRRVPEFSTEILNNQIIIAKF